MWKYFCNLKLLIDAFFFCSSKQTTFLSLQHSAYSRPNKSSNLSVIASFNSPSASTRCWEGPAQPTPGKWPHKGVTKALLRVFAQLGHQFHCKAGPVKDWTNSANNALCCCGMMSGEQLVKPRSQARGVMLRTELLLCCLNYFEALRQRINNHKLGSGCFHYGHSKVKIVSIVDINQIYFNGYRNESFRNLFSKRVQVLK